MLMWPWRTVRRMMIIIARIVVMLAAMRGMFLRVHMVQREHAATQSGDHAEHHEPCKHAAHADQKPPIAGGGKRILSLIPAEPHTNRGSR